MHVAAFFPFQLKMHATVVDPIFPDSFATPVVICDICLVVYKLSIFYLVLLCPVSGKENEIDSEITVGNMLLEKFDGHLYKMKK